MNVLLISQCRKNALVETRRILDQFAERRGERTWQTAITMEGLGTLRKLLRKTARKNTAVACHWIRGKDHSELMWIVGDASQFNAEGAAPTNTTKRNVLRHGDENDWHTGEIIQLLAMLAGLLHDLGKAIISFQERLHGSLYNQRFERNLYRHEWVSLRLFLAFVGKESDLDWLQRLADVEADITELWRQPGRYLRDGLDVSGEERFPFRQLIGQAPLAAALGWLVVTHHRLPLKPGEKDGKQTWLGAVADDLYAHKLPGLAEVAHNWNEVYVDAPPKQVERYWTVKDGFPVVSPAWRKQAAKAARRLLALQQLKAIPESWLNNPYVMHLARLCLMLSDHYYSSLGQDDKGRPVSERNRFLQTEDPLFANTTKDRYKKRILNQSLVEHLLGVAHGAAAIARALPAFERHLPRLAHHRGLRKRSANPRFAWQDKAYDAAMAIREPSTAQGAFIINMASTGCGKTLANARILYALSDPGLGMRATYALGLRTLTLQTGRSYRNDLHLDDDELAILVGGSASRALFEYYEQKAEQTGSASVQSLLEEDSHVLYEGNTADHPLLSRAMANPLISRLLSAPMLVCTVDHLVPATESSRAGRQIAPMLRLMSSDLILDELDDYGLNDLPALTRLVYWAGLLGSRVVLSSATLPPALLQGMFSAYHAGRGHYLKNRGADGGQGGIPEIPCLWVDEFGTHTGTLADERGFVTSHNLFIDRRIKKLAEQPPLRRAEILPLMLQNGQREQVFDDYARVIRDACWRLHLEHAGTDPETGKQVSFGIVRMANIEPLVQIAQRICAMEAPQDTQLHLCVYHSRFPLVQRSAIENMLDRSFNRRGDEGALVFREPEVRRGLDASPVGHHLFVVLASPVCEVGRDWDADWAVAEPSSMRALIQLAGRVQRHRRQPPVTPNMLLLDAPIKHCLGMTPAYIRPGFESAQAASPFRLTTPWLHELLAADEYQTPSAAARIRSRPSGQRNPQRSLVDLEHARMEASMAPIAMPDGSVPRRGRNAWQAPRLEQEMAAPGWQFPHALLTGVLPQYQPFRGNEQKSTTLVFLPDEDEEQLVLHRVEDGKAARGEKLYVLVDQSLRYDMAIRMTAGVSIWGEFDLMELLREQADSHGISLRECAEKMAVVDVLASDFGWQWHSGMGFVKNSGNG